jgi:hypothetical protein
LLSRARSFTRRARAGVFLFALFAITAVSYRPPFAQLVPPLAAPPLATADLKHPAAAGQTLYVPAGGDLQTVLDQARPGDIVALEAGAVFVGNFTLPRKSGADWIVIRTAEPQTLPSFGVRIAPTDANALPRILTPNAGPAIAAESGAHHFHFIGIEIAAADGRNDTVETLVHLAGATDAETDVPADIIFDRCYIHGRPAGGVRRGVDAASARTAVVDSYFSDFYDVAESQALAVNGPGPFKIVNNYFAAAGENVVLGLGRAPAAPSDIEIRGNYFHKPLSWKTAGRETKDFLAVKAAQRVLIENNVFENNWSSDEGGFAVLLAGDTRAPSVVQDITFRKNIVRRSGAGVGIAGQTPEFPARQTRRVLIQDNFLDEIGGPWGGSGVLFQMVGDTADVVIDHNTGVQNGKALVTDGATHSGFVYQNNIALDNQTAAALGYGDTWAVRFPGYVFARNVLSGGNPSGYPAENFFPGSAADIGFVDAAGGDYRLSAVSPYFSAGTDGANIGADYEMLKSTAAAAVSGGRNS